MTSEFGRLLACIRSGQLTEEQIAAELRNPAFAAFYRQQTGDRPMCDKTATPTPTPTPAPTEPVVTPQSGGTGNGPPKPPKD